MPNVLKKADNDVYIMIEDLKKEIDLIYNQIQEGTIDKHEGDVMITKLNEEIDVLKKV